MHELGANGLCPEVGQSCQGVNTDTGLYLPMQWVFLLIVLMCIAHCLYCMYRLALDLLGELGFGRRQSVPKPSHLSSQVRAAPRLWQLIGQDQGAEVDPGEHHGVALLPYVAPLPSQLPPEQRPPPTWWQLIDAEHRGVLDQQRLKFYTVSHSGYGNGPSTPEQCVY